MKIFRDRQEAGRRLAPLLERFAGEDAIVLGLPRGGVPVAYEVASALGLPLDVLIVRKIGAPFQPELGLGAVTEGGTSFVDDKMCAALGVAPEEIDAIAARETVEIARRVRRYRNGRPLPALAGKTVILVDDVLTTGSTAEACARALKRAGATRVELVSWARVVKPSQLMR